MQTVPRREAAPPTVAVGICGFAGSGKSTVAQMLVEEFGFAVRGTGKPLKDMLLAFGLTQAEVDGVGKELPCARLLGRTPRHAQITLGTQWGRQLIHPDLWAEAWLRAIPPGARVLNDSMRFPNEERVIRQLGGLVVRIERPGVGPVAFKWGFIGRLLHRWFGLMWGVHDSERVDRLASDFEIINDGSIDDLRRKVAEIGNILAKSQATTRAA